MHICDLMCGLGNPCERGAIIFLHLLLLLLILLLLVILLFNDKEIEV